MPVFMELRLGLSPHVPGKLVFGLFSTTVYQLDRHEREASQANHLPFSSRQRSLRSRAVLCPTNTLATIVVTLTRSPFNPSGRFDTSLHQPRGEQWCSATLA